MDDKLLRVFVENVPTLCWMANVAGEIFWFNKRWHAYCGTNDEQMKDGGWTSVHDPEMLPEIFTEWTKAFKAQISFELTMPLRGADGNFRPFLTQVEPACAEDGTVIGWIGVHTDITAQQTVETQLQSAQGQLRAVSSYREAILGQLAEGVIITDVNGRILFVNEAANKLHGVAKLDVEPDDYANAYSLFTEEGDPHPTETLPLTRAVLNDETVIGARWLIRRIDGTEVLAIGNAQPVFAPQGSKIGAVLTIHDDTQRYAIEKALAEAVVAKEALLYEVNHRVKNSLQIVTSLLTLQSRNSRSAELKQSLKEASSRVDIVASLHRKLYAEGDHSSVDLGSYIEEFATETVGAFADPEVVKLQFENDAKINLGMDTAVPLALIIGELLTNAIKYAFGGKADNRILIRVGADEDMVQILVSDNGRGLPAGFDPSVSSGFGTMIVNALLQQISGRLEHEIQDRGTGFVILFPR
ncbi:MAG: histidine kinase dimerization/phosphoacceptor domain -containing protein [Sphingorhabdus sp.]